MENLAIYNKVRSVPKEAQKTIQAGRLKGMTDINPMWRIKTITEQFGVCGIGWYSEIVRTWIDDGANEEKTANVEIKLYVKIDGEWSKGIVGIGGSSLISKEKNGLYTDDECYKKAYTDAISVACKALGIGADVYWEKDKTKYEEPDGEGQNDDEKIKPVGITLEDIKALGVGNPEKTLAWLEKNIGKPASEFTQEEKDECLAFISERQSKKGA